MRNTRTVMVEKEITTYKCDLCNYSIEHNKGCCGFAPIMVCNVCKKDCCTDCRKSYFEDWGSDYHDWLVCSECEPLASLAWEIAQQTAGRYESMSNVAETRLEEIKKGEWAEELEEYKNRPQKKRVTNEKMDFYRLLGSRNSRNAITQTIG